MHCEENRVVTRAITQVTSCVLRKRAHVAPVIPGEARSPLFFSRRRLDYGMSSTERLYEYISARTYGEHQGNCAAAYPQCPFSVFSLMGDLEENVYGTSNNIP